MREPPALDLLLITDIRIGDTAAETDLLLAQSAAEAGWSVGVLPWFGAARAVPTALAPKWRELTSTGRVRRIDREDRASARLALATDMRLFRFAASRPPSINAECRAVIVPRRFASGPADALAAVSNAEEALGGAVSLFPAAAPMRTQIGAFLPRVPVSDDDWPPVAAPLPPPPGPPVLPNLPRLGYVRANIARPWPTSTDELRAALPRHPLIDVHAMAPPAALVDELARGSTPARLHAWAGEPVPFLRSIDMLSCDDDPDDDPWPQEALLALTAGTVPVLRRSYRGIFMAAAVYAGARDLAETVIDLFGNRDLMQDLREAAGEMMERQLAPAQAVERLAAFLGPPPAEAKPRQRQSRVPGNVLSLSTNGVGMGHLTRQLAICRRLDPELRPVFLSFSQAVGELRRFGYVTEHLPYHASIGMNRRPWNRWLAAALDAACRFYAPRAFLLDANLPFPAVEALRKLHPGLPMIWVRRAMWGDDRDVAALEKARIFDLVLEPGEVAEAYDRGPTSRARAKTRRVAPIRLLSDGEQLDRAAACADIGIETSTLNVLVLPGAQNNFEGGALLSEIYDEMRAWPGARVVAASWTIAEAEDALPPHVVRRAGFPYARWFKAFDFAISAAGYNSFAELMGARLPTIFIPNQNPLMDRQDLRARFAERRGLGLHLSVRDRHRIRDVLRRMRAPCERDAFRERMAALPAANGADEAAALVTEWARAGLASREDAWL